MKFILDARGVIAELKALKPLTSDAYGAQRVAFGPGWVRSSSWIQEKLPGLPAETHTDEVGDFWVTLRGASPRELVIGGQMDSVSNGGRLDGCLNVLAGVEILRRIDTQSAGQPPEKVWRVGSEFERVKDSGRELQNIAAYLELHFEQGPVLLDLDLPLGVVLRTFGVERHAVTFRGRAAHSGSLPMKRRKDVLLAAEKMSWELYGITERSGGGVCTIGACTTKPGIVTSVVEECRIALDQRHLDPRALARMLADANEASERFAREGHVEVSWERLWDIPPRPVHPELISWYDAAIMEKCGRSHRLPSGPLHDAAGVGVPTFLVFGQSLHSISLNKIEDTKEEHLELCGRVFDRWAGKTMTGIDRN